MRLSRIRIQNFRNFRSVNARLGANAVIVGENRIGKSNFLHAVRIVLDPALPESARSLRSEDFWDGLPKPLRREDKIVISVDLADFQDDPNQVALLADFLVEPSPMVARLTYAWQIRSDLEGEPKRSSDYEPAFYGGDRPESHVPGEVRRRLPFELIPALRDCEGELARWGRSPLRPLLDRASAKVDGARLDALAAGVNDATDKVARVAEVRAVATSISGKMTDMVGSAQAVDTALQFAPTDSEQLVRSLRLFIDGGRRAIGDASLGSANLIYFALKRIEYDHLVAEGDRSHTFLAIEEPEAHLHPALQRLLFRDFLRQRESSQAGLARPASTVLLSTHSPHVASVAPLRDLVLLRSRRDERPNTKVISTTSIPFTDDEVRDLERYIDVNRSDILFARGVVLVEGDAERFLVPALAQNLGIDLDALGIVVCAVSGTNFAPYLRLLGPNGLGLHLVAFTDGDPRDGRSALGPSRVVNQMLPELMSPEEWDALTFRQLQRRARSLGVFMNDHTLEVDLFRSGREVEFALAMNETASSAKQKERMEAWALSPESLDVRRFLHDIDAVGKGRFAQRLAFHIASSATHEMPDYLREGLERIKARVTSE